MKVVSKAANNWGVHDFVGYTGFIKFTVIK
jgi:hypothetical protein